MPASSDSPTARNPSTTRTCSASCNPANQSPSQPSRPPLPSFALISFKPLFCGLLLIHSIRFDLIVLTVAARSSRTFATTTSSPRSCRCSLVQIEIRSRLHCDACQRHPENLVSPFLITWLKGLSPPRKWHKGQSSSDQRVS